MNLIDIRQVLTQIIGFLLMLWILRKYAWGPLSGMLEARREKIAGDFKAADRAKAEANDLKVAYEQKLRGTDAEARQRILVAVEDGQKAAAEIKAQAQAEASQRVQRAEDEILREREKAKEQFRDQVVTLSILTAEKILRQKIDDPTQRRLVGEFVDEVGAKK